MKHLHTGPHIFPTRRAVGIYKKRIHILITLGFLFIPFLFFLFLSRISHLNTATVFIDITSSITRITIAYAISVILGFLLAVFLYKSKFSTILFPVFDVLQSFPTFAALPLAVKFWGPNEITIIFFLIFTMVWPIFFTIISSLKLIRHEWEEAMEISGIHGWRYIWLFLIPASVPSLITGSIIGLGNAWEALIATEIIVNVQNGFGTFFQKFSTDPQITAFGIAGLLIIVFAINKLIWLPLLERSHRLHEE